MALPIQDCVGIIWSGQAEKRVHIRICRLTAGRGGFGGAGGSIVGTMIGSNGFCFLADVGGDVVSLMIAG
jgi:hypothetical protein